MKFKNLIFICALLGLTMGISQLAFSLPPGSESIGLGGSNTEELRAIAKVKEEICNNVQNEITSLIALAETYRSFGNFDGIYRSMLSLVSNLLTFRTDYCIDDLGEGLETEDRDGSIMEEWQEAKAWLENQKWSSDHPWLPKD